MNSFYEAGLSASVSFSTYNLSPKKYCSKLMQKNIPFNSIQGSSNYICEGVNQDNNQGLHNLIKEATIGIVVFDWSKGNNADEILQIVKNIGQVYGDKFLIFGSKRFDMNINGVVKLSVRELKYSYRVKPAIDDEKINLILNVLF